MATQLPPGSGDKLADIERYAQDLRASDIPAEAFVGENLILILKGKNLNVSRSPKAAGP